MPITITNLFDALFAHLFPYYDPSVLDISISDLLETYNVNTLKLQHFRSKSFKETGHTCDFASMYGGFHDMHVVTAEGKNIGFYKAETPDTPYLLLYICPTCLQQLKVGDLLKRCLDFSDTFMKARII